MEGGRSKSLCHILLYSAYVKEVRAHLSTGICMVTGFLVLSKIPALARFPNKGKTTFVWSLSPTTNTKSAFQLNLGRERPKTTEC